MKAFGDTFSFSGTHQRAATWGFLAGSLGAFGALTLTFAMMKAQGNAGLVMPIVFGGAVTVTALTTIVVARGQVTNAIRIAMNRGGSVAGTVVDKGGRPGENAVDTKQRTSNPRSRLTIRDTVCHGWRQPAQIENMSAVNLKNHVDV